jgi:hypothetical protein
MAQELVSGVVGSPVQAEILVVWLNGNQIELTGPFGAEPSWRRCFKPEEGIVDEQR